MKKFIFSAVIVLVFTSIVSASSLKGGYPACLTEDLFDQIVKASVKKDKRGWNYLLKNGCIITKAGIPISVLKTSWGTAKVRAYVGDTSIILWTNIENIED